LLCSLCAKYCCVHFVLSIVVFTLWQVLLCSFCGKKCSVHFVVSIMVFTLW